MCDLFVMNGMFFKKKEKKKKMSDLFAVCLTMAHGKRANILPCAVTRAHGKAHQFRRVPRSGHTAKKLTTPRGR